MNKLTLSTFLAFMLAKLTSLDVKLNKGDIEQDSLSSILNNTNDLFTTLHINDIKAFEIINLGNGFSGTEHILNYLITYIPVFYILLVLLRPSIFITIYTFIKSKMKKATGKNHNDFFIKNVKKTKDKEKGFNPEDRNLLLKFVLGKNYYEFA